MERVLLCVTENSSFYQSFDLVVVTGYLASNDECNVENFTKFLYNGISADDVSIEWRPPEYEL